jgi:hypothetical protein
MVLFWYHMSIGIIPVYAQFNPLTWSFQSIWNTDTAISYKPQHLNLQITAQTYLQIFILTQAQTMAVGFKCMTSDFSSLIT